MKTSKVNVLKYSEWAAFLSWGVLCFVYFHTNYYYHFFYQEQNQLFLMSWEYVSSYFKESAPLSQLIGDFLTQFYYYVFAGPAVLTLSILLIGIMTRMALSISICRKRKLIATFVALILMTIEASFCLKNSYRLSDVWSAVGWSIAITAIVAWCRWFYINNKFSAHRFLYSLQGIFVTVFFLLTYIGFGNPLKGEFVKPEKEIERLLSYDNEYYFEHYERVIAMGNYDKNQMVDNECFFYFLSLAHINSISYSLTEIEKPFLGTFLQIGPDTPLFTIKMMNELYFLLGDMTYAERAALMACTFSPNNRNVRMIKRLAEINLIKGDEKAAKKYLRLLSKTIVYKQWAKDHTPDTMTDKARKMIDEKRQFMNTCDGIRLGDNCRTILLELLESNPTNKVALDYLLCSDMLAGDKEAFVMDYEKFGPRPEPLYQQAYKSLVTESTKQQDL